MKPILTTFEPELTSRSGQCDCNRPFLKTIMKRCWLHIEASGPIGDTQRFTVEGNHQNGGGVSALFTSRCPTAVAGFVIAVIVGVSVKAVIFAWAFAHISKKVLERVPLVAHFNSTATIPMERLMLRIAASCVHGLPYPVLGRLYQAVSAVSYGGKLPCETAATLRLAASEVNGRGYSCTPAVTKTIPLFLVGIRDDCKPAESLSGQVLKIVGVFADTGLSHDVILSQQGRLWLEPERRSRAARLALFYQFSA